MASNKSCQDERKCAKGNDPCSPSGGSPSGKKKPLAEMPFKCVSLLFCCIYWWREDKEALCP